MERPQLWAMRIKERQTPSESDSGSAAPAANERNPKAAAKQARLAEALRANLGRRKAQARARAEDDDNAVPPAKPPRSA